MTKEELLAKMQASDNDPAVDVKRRSAFDTGMAKFLSTATGGLSDYFELADRAIRGEATPGGVDQVRGELAKDYENSPTAAMLGQMGGTAVQAIPVARGLSAMGALTKVPGIIGGLKSGAQIGAGVGAFNEVARLPDLAASVTRAAEGFNPWASAFRVGKETLAGGAGGAIGGAAGNYLTKGAGMIANRLPEPLKDSVIAAALAAQKAAEKVGLTGPGKLAPQESLRRIQDPALRAEGAEAAAGLEGLATKAGRDFQTAGQPKGQGMLPAEQEMGRFRTDLRTRTQSNANQAAIDAAKASTDAAHAQALRTGMARQQLNPNAYWAAEGDPAVKALRDQIIARQRAITTEELRSPPVPFNKKEATSAAAARHSPQKVESLEHVVREAPDAATRSAANRALQLQNPAFKAADDAITMMNLANTRATGRQAHLASLDDILNSSGVGRVNANIGQEPAKTGGGLFGFNLAMLARDMARVAKDAAERSAVRQAGRKIYTDPTEDLLRQLGRQTRMQQVMQQVGYPLTSGLLSGSQFLPE